MVNWKQEGRNGCLKCVPILYSKHLVVQAGNLEVIMDSAHFYPSTPISYHALSFSTIFAPFSSSHAASIPAQALRQTSAWYI